MTPVTTAQATPSEAELAAAKAVAEEVDEAGATGQPMVLFSVVDLMSRFDIKRLSQTARSRIVEAFDACNLVTEPGLQDIDVTRTIQVRSLLRTQSVPSSRASGLHALLYRSGADRGEELDPALLTDLVVSAGDVLWINVEPDADHDDLLALLRRHLSPNVMPEMISDLLEYDVEPRVQVYDDGLRSVSFVGVEPRESDQASASEAIGMAGELCFQLVESLVGDRAIVTCWHHGRICRGLDGDADVPSILRNQAIRAVDRAWATGPLTPGDVGTQILSRLTETYKHGHRRLESWLHLWELELHKKELKTETRTLNDLFALVNEFRRRLAAMNYAHSLAEGRTWFPTSDTATDAAADATLDRTLQKLALLFENIRADMELVTMQHVVDQASSASEVAKQTAASTLIAQEQRIANEQFQDRLAKVTALLLVPTLIAGVYGANTKIPGGGKWSGFETMVFLMVIASSAVYFFMLRANRAQSPRRAVGIFRRPGG